MSEVTKEMIDGWKAKFGKIQKLSLGGTDWIYRSINLDEYYSVQEMVNISEENKDSLGQEQIIKIATLSPSVPERIPAGITIRLSDEILKLSGFGSDEIVPEEL